MERRAPKSLLNYFGCILVGDKSSNYFISSSLDIIFKMNMINGTKEYLYYFKGSMNEMGLHE